MAANPHPDSVYERFIENISLSALVRSWHRAMSPSKLTASEQKPPPGTLIPQRPYCQGAVIQGGAAGQVIQFAMVDGGCGCYPAESALAGHCELLVDLNGTVFPDHNQTINMRIEVHNFFFTFRAVAYSTSPFTVAGVRWMGRTGECHSS